MPSDSNEDVNLENGTAPSTGPDQQDVSTGSSPDSNDVSTGSSPEGTPPESDQPEGSESYSPAEQDQQGFEEAIRQAAQTDGEADTTDQAQDEPASEGEQAQTEQSDSEQTADNGEDLQEGQRVPYDRFKSVIDARNQAQQELQQFREQTEPKAQEFDKVMNFVQEHELSNQDVAEAFQFLALFKNDPAQAREKLTGYMDQLDQFTGHKLPSDLSDEVDQGLMSEERAQEIAKLRNQSQFEQQRAEKSRQQVEQERQQQRQQEQQRQQQEAANAMRDTVADVEQRTAQSDPDYERIQPWVVKEMRLRMADQPPQNSQEARKLFEDSYNEVKKSLRETVGYRPEKKQSATSAHAGAGGGGSPSPSSFEDAIRQAANGTT